MKHWWQRYVGEYVEDQDNVLEGLFPSKMVQQSMDDGGGVKY